jgi:hypothetical protein
MTSISLAFTAALVSDQFDFHHDYTGTGTMRYLPKKSRKILLLALSCTLIVSACHKNTDEEQLSERDKVARLIPERVPDRKLWATDMLAIMDDAKIPHTLNNLCSIVAIVDQESNFHANPAVPNLPNDAKKALFERIQNKLGDTGVIQFKKMLLNKPAPDNSFMMQINKIKTEQDLDLLYRKMYDFFKIHYGLALLTGPASLITGYDFKEYFNPVKTLGSMQVNVDYAFIHPRKSSNTTKIRDDMYTQYGGLYYGINRLLGYQANYNKSIYRFADYNSGIYSSRNASFQQTISDLSDFPLDLDGDLLSYDKEQHALSERSNTETQLDILAQENNFGLSSTSIRGDLLKEKTEEFEDTATYNKINAFYLAKFKKEAPYAVMPHVAIEGPKLSRVYDTNWYAKRVNGRFQHCERIGRRFIFQKDPSQNNDSDNTDD